MTIQWTEDEITHLKSVTILCEHLRGKKPVLYSAIASHFPNRCISEIRAKINYLDRHNELEPELRPSAFTTEESWILHVAVKKFGGDFKLVREVYFREFSETKLKQRYNWQITNGWDDKFFEQYFPLLEQRDWGSDGDILNQEPWDGFLNFAYCEETAEESSDSSSSSDE